MIMTPSQTLEYIPSLYFLDEIHMNDLPVADAKSPFWAPN